MFKLKIRQRTYLPTGLLFEEYFALKVSDPKIFTFKSYQPK